MAMKKHHIHWGVGIVIIGVLVLAILGTQFLSVFRSMSDIQCSGTGTVQNCHSYGTNNAYISEQGNQFTFNLVATNLNPSEIVAWRQANSTVDAFFSQGRECQFAAAVTFKEYDSIPFDPAYSQIASYHASCSGGYYGTRTPSNPDGYYPSVPTQCAACSGSYYEYALGTFGGLTEAQAFPNQLMVITGLANTANGNIQNIPFTMYGFCNAGTCVVNKPANFTDGQGLASGTSWEFVPSSWNLYIKYGGYDPSNTCVQDGLTKCVGQNLYTCSSFSYVNSGLISGQCGYNIPSNPTGTSSTQTQVNNLTQTVQDAQNAPITQQQSSLINSLTKDSTNTTAAMQLSQSITAQNSLSSISPTQLQQIVTGQKVDYTQYIVGGIIILLFIVVLIWVLLRKK